MNKTKIEWTDATWNPITGCTKVSEGCLHCYGEAIAKRFWDRPFSDVRFHPERLEQPLHLRKPRRVFVCSMSDLFHESIGRLEHYEIINIIKKCPQHTFLVLTKRPVKMMDVFSDWKPLPNVWLGVTCENQQRADERIPILLQIPAAKRFVSIEPMLSEIYLYDWLIKTCCRFGKGQKEDGSDACDGPGCNGTQIDWVIAGCESGPGRRHAPLDWFRSLRDQCVAAGVPFFLKQADIGGRLVKMPELDGKIWNQLPL